MPRKKPFGKRLADVLDNCPVERREFFLRQLRKNMELSKLPPDQRPPISECWSSREDLN